MSCTLNPLKSLSVPPAFLQGTQRMSQQSHTSNDWIFAATESRGRAGEHESLPHCLCQAAFGGKSSSLLSPGSFSSPTKSSQVASSIPDCHCQLTRGQLQANVLPEGEGTSCSFRYREWHQHRARAAHPGKEHPQQIRDHHHCHCPGSCLRPSASLALFSIL